MPRKISSPLPSKKLKRSYAARPELKKGLRLTQRVVNPRNPSEAQYVPIFPLVFKDANLTYGKSYDVLMTHYLEVRYGKEPILFYEHKALYDDVLFHAEHGEAFYISDLARRRGITRHTLAYMIDRLEDARLVRRVRCLEQHGRPIHLIAFSPYEPYQMEEMGKAILKDVLKKVAAKERHKLGVNHYPALKWDLNTMLKAIAGEATNRQLRQMITAITFVEWLQASTGQRFNQEQFVEKVKEHCQQEKFTYSDKLLITAIAAKQINSTES